MKRFGFEIFYLQSGREFGVVLCTECRPDFDSRVEVAAESVHAKLDREEEIWSRVQSGQLAGPHCSGCGSLAPNPPES